MENALIIEHRGALAEISLNRPQALNALNDAMRAEIMAALPRFARDPEIYAVTIRSNSPRAFCAGGDVRELTSLARADPALAKASIRNEYLMNWALECFTKPTVSLIDGMVMGSGVGLMLYGTHRVAAENFRFSMPETAIGLFPDVGVCSVLAKLPRHIGRYLGLSGRAIGRAAAYRLGIATHCIAASWFNEITKGLQEADTIDPIVDGLHQDPVGEVDELSIYADLIDEVFGEPGVSEIFAALRRRTDAGGDAGEWCGSVLRDLSSRSPLSLFVTLRHLDECRELSLRDVLIRDYRLASRFLEGRDLQEGVRSLLIDKDGQPIWQHKSIEDVNSQEIEDYFASLGAAEMNLPDREKMQEIRG